MGNIYKDEIHCRINHLNNVNKNFYIERGEGKMAKIEKIFRRGRNYCLI